MLEWTATITSILGAALISFRRVQGFYVWIIANALWVWWAWPREAWGLITLVTVYSVLHVWGIVVWKKKEKADANASESRR